MEIKKPRPEEAIHEMELRAHSKVLSIETTKKEDAYSQMRILGTDVKIVVTHYINEHKQKEVKIFHRHHNYVDDEAKGGWVNKTDHEESFAMVGERVHLGPRVIIDDNSVIRDNARLTGDITVHDYVRIGDDAELSGKLNLKGWVVINRDFKLNGAGETLDGNRLYPRALRAEELTNTLRNLPTGLRE